MDTVLFTDNQVLVFAITASAISLVLTVLLVSTRVEKGVESVRILRFAKSSASIKGGRAALFQIDWRCAKAIMRHLPWLRFTPEGGHVQCTSACLLWGQSRCRKADMYPANGQSAFPPVGCL